MIAVDTPAAGLNTPEGSEITPELVLESTQHLAQRLVGLAGTAEQHPSGTMVAERSADVEHAQDQRDTANSVRSARS